MFERNMAKFAIWLCICSICFVGYDSAKILGVSWIPTISHQTFFNSIWKELSIRGHKVTAITSIPLRDKSLTNLTEIDTSELIRNSKKRDVTQKFNKDNNFWNALPVIKYTMYYFLDSMLNIEAVKELINSDAEFDLVIAEVHEAAVYAFGERFKAPVVGK